jgi:hypothetical protein
VSAHEYVSNGGEVRVVAESADADRRRVIVDRVDRTRTAEPITLDGKVIGWRIKDGER